MLQPSRAVEVQLLPSSLFCHWYFSAPVVSFTAEVKVTICPGTALALFALTATAGRTTNSTFTPLLYQVPFSSVTATRY